MSDNRPETVEPQPQRPVLAQKPPSAPVSGGGGTTVYVACKHPNGLELTWYDQVDTHLATPSGVEKVKTWKRNGDRSFRVEGPTNIVNPHAPGPHLLRFQDQYGGYAVTPGCPREVWEHWSKWNFQMLDDKLLAAFDSQEDAIKWCKAQRDVRSGLEPIDPMHPEVSTGIRGIQPTTIT